MSRKPLSLSSQETRRLDVSLCPTPCRAITSTGKCRIVPANCYPPLEQGVVIVTKSQRKKEAADFLERLKTKEASDVLCAFGFTLPQK